MSDPTPSKPIFKLEPWNRGLPDEQLLKDLKRVSAELDRGTVTYDEYDSHGQFCSATLERRFGGWNRALETAGLIISKVQGLSKENFFENLEAVWVRLGRQPRRAEMIRPLSSISKSAYEQRFGTWRKALEEFVEWVNSETCDINHNKPLPASKQMRPSPRFPSLRLKFLVMRRDRFACCHCGKSPSQNPGIQLHIDHIVPSSKGGTTILDNLQTLCQSCNIGKSDLNNSNGG